MNKNPQIKPPVRTYPVLPTGSFDLVNCIRQRVSNLPLSCKSNEANCFFIEYEDNDTTSMSLVTYSKLAAERRYDSRMSHTQVQESFWQDLKIRANERNAPVPIYAIDNEMSCFPKEWRYFNLSQMTADDSILNRLPGQLMPGVNTPFVYFSMANTAFGLHSEDSNVGSINVHHQGSFFVFIFNIYSSI